MQQKKMQQSKIDFAENNFMKIGEATSAMGDQRADGLAGEIVAFQEGKHRHGHGRPPVGEGNNDGVILLHVLHPRRQFWSGVFIGDYLPEEKDPRQEESPER